MLHKVTAALALAALCLVAGCGSSKVTEEGIVLAGHGVVRAMPNVAELRLTVQSRDRDNNSVKAIEANSKKCESVRGALDKLVPSSLSPHNFFLAGRRAAYLRK